MPQVDITTQHNDNRRTGANLQEIVLNTMNVKKEHFGKVCTYHVQGDVYAQPLYMGNMNNPGKGIVYIATMHNIVYAFNADDRGHNPTQLWERPLEPPIPLPDPNIGPPGYSDITGQDAQGHPLKREVGILSTPVISRDHNAIYVVTASKDPNRNDPSAYSHHLHALDLTTGADLFGGPIKIQATVAGTGSGSSNGQITFTSNRQNQRPALLLANDTIYIAFAAYGDQHPYHGWVLGYNALHLQQQVAVLNTTPTGGEGGIWQAGQGLAADDANNLYCITGNGSFNGDSQKPPTALGDCIIKLKPDLTLADWFSPKNNQELNTQDYDLGSSGPLLIPSTNLLVGGGKDGKFYLLNRDQLGFIGHSVQDFFVSLPDDPQHPFPPQAPPARHTHHIHGGPVYWNGSNGAWVYIWPENDVLKAFELLPDGTFDTKPTPDPIMGFSNPQQGIPSSKANERSMGMPGGMLSLSANGNTAGTGILWASHPVRDANNETVPGILRAYDASDLTKELWHDDVETFAKFCPPTIANGRVYMATFSNAVQVYGLL